MLLKMPGPGSALLPAGADDVVTPLPWHGIDGSLTRQLSQTVSGYTTAARQQYSTAVNRRFMMCTCFTITELIFRSSFKLFNFLHFYSMKLFIAKLAARSSYG